MSTILVTGGTGYIGSHTVIDLLNNNHDVVIIDNYSNSKPTVLDRIENLAGKRPTFYESDVQNREVLTAIFQKYPIEAVIHFAGYKAVGESVEKPIKYYDNNINSTLALLEIMDKFGVRKIVFSSSATVYGMNNKVPFTEDMPLSTTNPYGSTKLFIEQILKDQVISNHDWSVVLLRYFNPIGAHPSGTIGEDPTDIPNNLMPYITQVAIGKREELSVFGDDYETHDGTGVRDFIHVQDLAQGHTKAIEHVLKYHGLEAINLGSGSGYSVLDLVKAFEKANDIAIPYSVTPRRPGDIAESYADTSRAKEILNWEAEHTLEDMVRDSWKWQKSNPNGYED